MCIRDRYSFAFSKGLQLMGSSPFWFGSLGGTDDWVSPSCNAQFRPMKVVWVAAEREALGRSAR